MWIIFHFKLGPISITKSRRIRVTFLLPISGSWKFFPARPFHWSERKVFFILLLSSFGCAHLTSSSRSLASEKMWHLLFYLFFKSVYSSSLYLPRSCIMGSVVWVNKSPYSVWNHSSNQNRQQNNNLITEDRFDETDIYLWESWILLETEKIGRWGTGTRNRERDRGEGGGGVDRCRAAEVRRSDQ